MRDSMEGLVAVITGASSGIGRATAHELARHGASLVLAARREPMLRDAVRECEALGGAAIAVAVDVAIEDEVERLAQAAVERFGRIDVWFNNAGVGVFGRFEQIPADVWARVIQTNLMGCVHGARAALRQFRRQGRGVLINNASIVGRLSKPDSSAYATSKFAIRGFAEALRQETLDEPDIRVCTILPSVIDTPFFEHAANFSGKRVRAAPPVYLPEKVAETVVRLIEHPRAETVVGGAGKLGIALREIAPTLTMRLDARALHAGFLAEEPSPRTSGAVLEPMHDGLTVRGRWRHGANDGGVPLLVLGLAALPLAWMALRRMRTAG